MMLTTWVMTKVLIAVLPRMRAIYEMGNDNKHEAQKTSCWESVMRVI